MMNRTKQLLVVALVAAFSLIASAQANVQTNVYAVTNVVTVLVTNIVTVTNVVVAPPLEAPAPAAAPALVAPVKSPWESAISAGLTLTRGNSDTMLVTAGAVTEKKGKVNEWEFGADGAYGEDTGKKNVDTVHAFGQVNHLITEKFYVYLRANALHDGIADLQYRLTLGPGLGYYLLKETNTTLAFEAGSAYVIERLGDEDNTYATLRLAEHFERKFFDQKARIWQSIEILPQVDDFNNYIVNAEIGIEAALSAKFSLQTFLVDNYNNQPAAGREKNDVKLVSGLKYKF